MVPNPRPAEGAGLLGALFGAFLAIAITLLFGPFPLWATLAVAVVLGGVGRRYGDRFWEWVLARLRDLV